MHSEDVEKQMFFNLRDPSRYFGFNKLMDKAGSTNRRAKIGSTILILEPSKIFNGEHKTNNQVLTACEK